MASFATESASTNDSVGQEAVKLADSLGATTLDTKITESSSQQPPSTATATDETNKADDSTAVATSHGDEGVYTFSCDESRRRWCTEAPMRIVDYSLGYPILVCNDEGKYVSPSEDSEAAEKRNTTAAADTSAKAQVDISEAVLAAVQGAVIMKELTVGNSAVSGSGVFAATDVGKGEYIGAYRGTVLTDEEWESSSRAQSEFAFVINDGANGVVIDGQSGCAVNELKFINHSCEPNAVMKEVFAGGMWHVAVIALRDVTKGQELFHDYALVTENEESPEAEISCMCGAEKCRGTLFNIVDF